MDPKAMKSYLLWVLLIANPALAVEKLECGGTEPFWSGVLTDQQITFELSGTTRAYPKPTYAPATGTSADYVMSVRAKGKTGHLTGFVVNETLMFLADKHGKAPDDRFTFEAYCSDGMSDRGFPFSIHLIVDGKPYTGCCASASNPPVGQKE
jgi:uncharacterized membrane protein